MFKIPKQEYTAEFKVPAVKRVKSGESVGAVARDPGLVEPTLRNWVKAAKMRKLHAPGAKVVTPEQLELSRVRAENARLRMVRELRGRGFPASKERVERLMREHGIRARHKRRDRATTDAKHLEQTGIAT